MLPFAGLLVRLRPGEAEDVGEETLREASSRFTRAFQALEADARSAGEAVESLPAERRLAPWSAVSERLRGTP